MAELADALDSKSCVGKAQPITQQSLTKTEKPGGVDRGVVLDQELAQVASAWPSLPAALKAGILAMVKAAKTEEKP